MSGVSLDTDPGAVARRLRQGMAGGVLSFPLTSFHTDGSLDEDGFRAQIATAPGAVFPACGTGEFFSLDEDEYRRVVTITVEEAAGRLPVVAGTGYGWAQAARSARIAEEAGADALLVLPHYLTAAPQDGLVAQLAQLAARTRLPLIAYQRGQVAFTAASLKRIAAIDTVIGLKDGHSDLDRLQRLTLAAPEGFLFFNGAATAEIQARSRTLEHARAGGPPSPPSASPPTPPPCTPSPPRSPTPSSPRRTAATTARSRNCCATSTSPSSNSATASPATPSPWSRRRPGCAAARSARSAPPLTDPGAADLADLEALLATGLDLVGAAL
jgi:5-dehydro-4-deoxyglucarate dehydratase